MDRIPNGVPLRIPTAHDCAARAADRSREA